MASSSTPGSLLSAVLALILIHAPLGGGLPSTGCDVEAAACTADADCLACTTGVGVDGVTSTDCSYRYPTAFFTAEGSQPGLCETAGATNCCAFEDDATAETCMSNAAMVAYWQCQLIGVGCEVNDMPCYSGTVTNTMTPVGTVSPIVSRRAADDSLATPGPTTTQPIGGTRPPSLLSHSYSASSLETPPPSASIACEALSAECLEDPICLECATSANSTTTCSLRYPDVFDNTSGGASSGPGACESTGAEACCEFSDNGAANECMADEVTAAFWLCKVESEGCSAEDMPCYNAAVTAVNVTSSTTDNTLPPQASDSSSSPATKGDAPTPAPTTANEGDAEETEANANGAVGMPVSPNVVFASGLLVAAASMFLG